MRRNWQLILIFVCSVQAWSITPSAADELPNVVVFLADDQGFGDFSHTGNRDLETPNIDGLARDGAYVENFYVCPVCSPTRAEFLTGRYHPRGGVYSTSAGGERLDLDESTIAESFREAGYITAAFGKWHNGMQAPYHPLSRGFDEYYGFCSGHWGHYFSPMLEHNGKLVRGNGYIVDDLTDHAIQFIDVHQERPFFVFLPYNIPHSPMQVPDKYWNKFADKPLTQLPQKDQPANALNHARAALAMCENIDHNVGRVLAKLDELNLANNTIVVYFSDNGPNGDRYNAGLKGRKGSTDEGGVRTPLFMRWPEKIPAGTQVDLVTGGIDLFPTLTELCGIDARPNHPFDGISFASELLGRMVKRPPRYLFSTWNNRISVRSQQYRLDHRQNLFDLSADPSQSVPLTDQPVVKSEMMAAANVFKTQVLSELDRSQRRFPVGHPSMDRTQLPARDAKATGEIKRSNKYPNCSYFTHWVNEEDEISWPVEIVDAGRFKATLYYGCANSNLAPTIELSLGDQKISKAILEANDPPLVGAAADRSVRGESLVKDFKPFDLGKIEFPAGPGTLTLRSLEIPGEQSIEFRLLMLTRID